MSDDRNAMIRDRLALLGLPAQAALVAAAVAAVALLVAPVAFQISGVDGLWAVATGAGVNLLGAELALALTALFRSPAAALHAVAVGMIARTAVPLLLGAVLQVRVAWLAGAGMVFYLLIFYFLTLCLETMLTLAQVAPGAASRKSN